MMKSRSEKGNGKKKFTIICGVLIFFIFSSLFSYFLVENMKEKAKDTKIVLKEPPKESTPANLPKDKIEELLISFVGDCTLGHDSNFAYENSLPQVLDRNNNDYSYFFKNVADIFRGDDITVANLETTFTNSNEKADKQFTFKSPPAYAKALTAGCIEAVNLSNNHIFDYLDQGFTDTTSALKDNKINFFGEGSKWLTEIKGAKLAFLGYRGFSYDNEFLVLLKKNITSLKAENYIVIINFHWGDENTYYPNETQKHLAHFSIDNGADLIIGHHPHVVQGIEQYKGKPICYSLGNFCFGGNQNPEDKDTFIFQVKFNIKNSTIPSYGIKVIPCSISAVSYINDYCPTPLQGDSKKQVMEKINTLSDSMGSKISEEFLFYDVKN